MPRPCIVCGTANATCGGPTTVRGIGDGIAVERIGNKMAAGNLVRVETQPGILTKMTEEEADRYNQMKDSGELSDRTRVLSPHLLGAETNAAGVIETKPVEPGNERSTRRPIGRPAGSPNKPAEPPKPNESGTGGNAGASE